LLEAVDVKLMQNSSRLSVIAFALSAFAAILLLSPAFAKAGCDLDDDNLVSKFLQAARSPTLAAQESERLARWSKKDLVIGVFQDRSAQAPTNNKRNLSIFKAIGNLGSIFQFGVNFSGKSSEIDLVFLSEARKQAILLNLPVGSVVAGPVDRCPVYFDFSISSQEIREISRAHILVASDLNVDELPFCVELALINAVGLVGWRSESGQDPLTPDRYAELSIFVSALYRASHLADISDIRREVKAAKKHICRN
jgi:hypothetical protein